MSLYKDASLVMIPSAYKDGKLYSIRPTDGDGDFTFSRGSNLAATRVDVNGLIEKGRENLLLQSNQFDTTWATYDTSVTGGQTGYDGTNDAWILAITGATGFQTLRQSISNSGTQTFSIYAKAGALDWMRINTGASNTYFDIANGAVGADSSIGATIESAGNGYYRCSVPLSGSLTFIFIYPAFDNNNPNQTSGSIYIQDAQLEQGLVATDYIETGASTAQAGILEDMPRLDYSGSCPSLLLEPQRSNLLTHSEYFGGWALSNATLVANDIQSPEGIVNAYKLKENTANSTHFSWLQATTASATHCFSIFAKAGERKRIALRDNQIGNSAVFDLESGSVVSGSGGSIIEAANGFYRITLKGNYASAGTRHEIYILPDNATTATTSYQGDGKGIYIYGAQLEVGSYPTSYIPTYGTSQTRSKDGGNLQLDGVKTNGYFGDTYTLFFEFDELDFGAAAGNFNYLYDDSNATCMYVYGGTLSINTTSGEAYTNFTQGFTDSSKGKFLVKYDGSEVKIFKDGSLYRTYTNPSLRWDNPKFYRLSLASATASISYKQFLTFPTALTDSECIALTTL